MIFLVPSACPKSQEVIYRSHDTRMETQAFCLITFWSRNQKIRTKSRLNNIFKTQIDNFWLNFLCNVTKSLAHKTGYTMSRYEPLWVTMSHYELPWATISLYESLWAPMTQIIDTTTHYDPNVNRIQCHNLKKDKRILSPVSILSPKHYFLAQFCPKFKNDLF